MAGGITDGARWRHFRERAGLSLRTFAKAIDVSPTYVSRVETGEERRGYARVTTMRAICELGLSREEASEVLSFWRTFHASEVAAIDQFISEVQP